VDKLLRDTSVLDRLAKQGVEPRAMTPDALNALLREDFQRMARVVKASGARID
jgi:tripartite-type tricarboxylate transporter receptor subunit TctC